MPTQLAPRAEDVGFAALSPPYACCARRQIVIRLLACRHQLGSAMSRPLIFTISAAWDDEAAVWTGHCDDIPAAADAPTLDELLSKISAMALDLLPDNHPGVDPASVYLQLSAARSWRPRRPEWLRSSTAPSGTCCERRPARSSGKAKAATRFGIARSPSGISRCRSGFQAAIRRMQFCAKPAFPRLFDQLQILRPSLTGPYSL